VFYLYFFVSLFVIICCVLLLDGPIAVLISRIFYPFGITVAFHDTSVISIPLFVFLCWLSYRFLTSRVRARQRRVEKFCSLVKLLLERYEDPNLPSCETMILCEVEMRLSGKRPCRLSSKDPEKAAVDLLHRICIDTLATDWGRYTSGALTDFGQQIQHLSQYCSDTERQIY